MSQPHPRRSQHGPARPEGLSALHPLPRPHAAAVPQARPPSGTTEMLAAGPALSELTARHPIHAVPTPRATLPQSATGGLPQCPRPPGCSGGAASTREPLTIGLSNNHTSPPALHRSHADDAETPICISDSAGHSTRWHRHPRSAGAEPDLSLRTHAHMHKHTCTSTLAHATHTHTTSSPPQLLLQKLTTVTSLLSQK